MLRISKKADYAVFLLGAIAREGAYPGGNAADSVVSAHEIANRCGLNKSVVANLLKDFARAGLLDSTRGLRGGYRLVRGPDAISLREILEVVEGKFELVDCVSHQAQDDECALIDICPSKNPMRVVHDRISNLFESIHLDELCCLGHAVGQHSHHPSLPIAKANASSGPNPEFRPSPGNGS